MGRVPSPLSCGIMPTQSLYRHTATVLRPSLPASSSSTSPTVTATLQHQQIRRATFISRPRRPYTFTQLVTLSDGSTYTIRTTSPQPIYRATKDTRNTLTWQPSEKSLKNVELDEAGRLAAFRERFGRAFDTQASEAAEGGAKQTGKDAAAAEAEEDVDDGYHDLISSYAPADTGSMKDANTQPKKKR